MPMTEIKLLSLAWSLAMNPTPSDLSVFAALTPPDQAIVRQLVEQHKQWDARPPLSAVNWLTAG